MKPPKAPSPALVEILESRIAPAAASSINLDQLNGQNGFKLHGVQEFGNLGYNVSGIGDINNDGYDDIAAATFGAGEDGEGLVYVLFGKAGGFAANTSVAALNGTNGFAIRGVADDDILGRWVSGVGDMNGDGFDDFVVTSSNHDGPGIRSGIAYVIFGKATPFPAEFNPSTLNGTNGFAVGGNAGGDSMGYCASAAGDINGDGFDDVLLNVEGFDGGEKPKAGMGIVVFGKSTAFNALMTPNDLNGSNGFRLLGVNTYDRTSFRTAFAGDVNGDGFDDIALSATGAYAGAVGPMELRPGAVYVVFGKNTGFSANFNLSSLNGTNGFRVISEGKTGGLGGSLSGNVDVNGDGFDDIIIGRDNAEPAGLNSGSLFVVFGKNTAYPATLHTVDLNGTNGFRINGKVAKGQTGSVVSGAGDVNKDGIDDFLFSDDDETKVVYGTRTPFPAIFDQDTINGSNGFKLAAIHTFRAAGDVNGDGYSDIIFGERGASPGNVSGAGTMYLLFGFTPGAVGPSPTLSISPDEKSATYRDWDGDLVTLKSTRGQLKFDMFEMSSPNPATGGFQLLSLDLSEATADAANTDFTDTSLTFTAKRGTAGGNGFVNVGYINATGVDINFVTIPGDLGRLDAGTVAGDPREEAMMGLTVQSLGLFGTSTQGSGGGLSTGLTVHGAFPKLTVKDDVRASIQILEADGKLGAVTIGGAVVAEGTALTISAKAGIGTFTVGTDLRANGAPVQIKTDGPLGTLTVNGSIAGSSAANHVLIEAAGQLVKPTKGLDTAIKAVTVKGSVEFAHIGAGTGTVANADASIGTITVSGSWLSSSVRAGVAAGGDGQLGTADDAKLTGDTALVATIGSFTVKGQAFGSAAASDMFGVVAEQVNKAKVGTKTFTFKAATKEAYFAAPTGVGTGAENPAFDFTIRELGAATPTVALGGPNLTLSTDGKTATFIDVDGDAVTIKRTKGTFAMGDFAIDPKTGGGGQLTKLTVTPAPDNVSTNLTVTAKPGADGGNGFVNIGEIAATGTLLGTVSIAGDVGQFNGGLATGTKAGVSSFTVQSMHLLGLTTGATSPVSTFANGAGKITVKNDVAGAEWRTSGAVQKFGAITVTGYFNGNIETATSITSLNIGGTVRGAEWAATAGSIGAITVGGDLLQAAISAKGQSPAPAKGADLAIKSLTVKGSIESSSISVGAGLNPDASIGAVSVGHQWKASSLIAGVAGLDGFIGTEDDRIAPGTNSSSRFSSIASIVIKGQALGSTSTGDHFGIVAELIGKAQIGTAVFKLDKGERDTTDRFIAAPTGPGAGALPFDFYIREITAT